MKRRHQKVAGTADAVAGEDATRAVRAVCGGREADDQEAGAWIAESRYWFAPVFIVAVGAALRARDLLAVASKARTPIAIDDRRANVYQTLHAFWRTIGASVLQENAFANSGMFDTTPLTRNRGGACGLVCASMRSRSGRAFSHQL